MKASIAHAVALIAALVAALSLSTALMAKEAAPLAQDEAVEKRMVAISDEMRCLVCQNESLSGSRAELAQDLRREIRELIKQGKSDEEIMTFMVSRYGDFVRYRPPVKSTTWLLWFGPFILLAAGIVALMAFLRRRARELKAGGDAPLTPDEQQRAKALLESAGNGKQLP
jgi:cytochrome c-type biogenesis protein CcmH